MKKIKLDKIVVAVVIFIVCIVLTSVILMQFKTVEETDITEIENMRESELRKSLSEWKTKYEEASESLEATNKRIEEYNKTLENNKEASKLVDKELAESNVMVGKTDVYGEGVVVTLNDKDADVGAWDLLNLVNELKYAGAEAISINDIRVLNTTEIVDLMGYSYISVGGHRLEAPYVVKAIGNATYLSSILNLKDSGFVDLYKKNNELSVSMEIKDKIEILKSSDEMSYKYLSIEEEEK